jgi:hypothetical protein
MSSLTSFRDLVEGGRTSFSDSGVVVGCALCLRLSLRLNSSG